MSALAPLVGQFLAHQRWFAGRGVTPEIVDIDTLPLDDMVIRWLLVEARGATYQVLVGERPEAEALAVLSGQDSAVMGTLADGSLAYDALADPAMALRLLEFVSDGAERAERVRPVGGEQSNTSLIYDDRLILKVFRRVQRGLNPDVEVSLALDEVGFNHVAAPAGNWRRDDYDLAIVRELLVGGSEGWALALTSLRDLCAHAVVGAGEAPVPAGLQRRLSGEEASEVAGLEVVAAAGGDFGAEARRLGEMTAKLHLALAEGLGTEAGDPAAWADDVAQQMALAGLDPGDTAALRAALCSVSSPGVAIRVHGDYHLGQVMRTDLGWFVLDFEGEPTRPLSERRRRRSALKDVAGMLRSFDYATAVALRERGGGADAAGLGRGWERRNRTAFLQGYRSTPRIDTLMPGNDEDLDTVLRAMEVEKAAYELAYEQAYRPDWVDIPERALGLLLGAGTAS